MNILEKAQAHFNSLEGGKINVPEWGCEIFWNPLTLHDEARIFARDEETGIVATAEKIWVRTLIRCAKDADGNAVFDAMDENKLLHGVDRSVLKRVSAAILDGSSKQGNLSDKIDQKKAS